MNEQKFSIINLSIEMIILKIMAIKSDEFKTRLKGLYGMSNINPLTDEDLSEDRVALELDDIYEYGVLLDIDTDDKDVVIQKNLVEGLMRELPNFEEYKIRYGWYF